MSDKLDDYEQYLMRQLLIAYYAGCAEYARLVGEKFPYSFKEFCKEIFEIMLDNVNL